MSITVLRLEPTSVQNFHRRTTVVKILKFTTHSQQLEMMFLNLMFLNVLKYGLKFLNVLETVFIRNFSIFSYPVTAHL